MLDKVGETNQSRASVIVKTTKEDLAPTEEEKKDSLVEEDKINSYKHKKFDSKIDRKMAEEEKKTMDRPFSSFK